MHVVHAATVLRVRAVKLIASRHIRLWRRCLGNARARTAKHDENTGKHCCRTKEHWARSKRFDGRVDGHGLYPRLNEIQHLGCAPLLRKGPRAFPTNKKTFALH